ncbi:MAG: STM4012 family radical SAM protein [Bacteroidota bacterium]
MTDLHAQFRARPYAGYAYSYPHKTAYRDFTPPVSLAEAWATERKDALFLYAHIPFCEMRCGFCNLFTVANPKAELENPYLDALARQVRVTREALGSDAKFARLAIGGGTPTYLELPDLRRLFSLLREGMGADTQAIPVSVEMSPGTIDREKLQFLKDQGVDRVSIGVQSFHTEIAKAMGRPNRPEIVQSALELLRDMDFPTLNIDLIYGGAGQSPEKWQESLEATLEYAPREVFLYPLYVRPLTGLDKTDREWADMRLALYVQGRDFLLAQGYTQMSMRMFRKVLPEDADAPVYRCQEDGMVGLGVGARSYTRGLHYSSRYAVGRNGLRNIISAYNSATEADFAEIPYGVRLSLTEQKRRYVIQSLLHFEGLSAAEYAHWFGAEVVTDMVELGDLERAGLAKWEENSDARMILTEKGMALSDAIGPWLYSAQVRDKMEAYELV